MKAALLEVVGKNRYCGPTALATILGVTTDEAAFLIRKHSGQKAVKGAKTHHLVAVLREAGCKVRVYGGAFRKEDRPTVTQWLSTQAKALPSDRHIVLVHGNHFGTLLGRRYLCTLTKKQSVAHKDIPKRRARVEEWFVVQSLPEKPVVVTLVRRADPERGARQKAKALAELHGVEIEVEPGRDGNVIVWGLKDLPDAEDPHEGDHYANGWADALERVQEYVDISTKRKVAAEKAATTPNANTLEPA